MDVSWLSLVLVAAILVSMVLLAVTCLHCRNKGPLASIRQASEDYMPSIGFRVIHPSQPTNDLIPIHSPSNTLSPFSLSADPGSHRIIRPVTPTETESNPSYENPADGPEYVNGDSDPDDNGYIIVLPEGEDRQSRASTPSSDILHDYENVPEKEDREYLNVDPLHFLISATDLSAQSDSDDDEDDDDDDEGNYVNVQEGTQTA